ncbi:polysaccharide deacetylase family protein [Robiginitomaculum antarcticum]|uniref:polysaccharide deacetylase family protein n=1 Tax=Robiginitomaculum antarcticum TaxID=437507 RepID=UPI00035D8935|nr:polysaccharide deacetylase family protein [Robiginitomaculum antarcticum]
MISRRLFLASSAALAAVSTSACGRGSASKRFAITMDDFNLNTAGRQTIEARNQGILEAMAAHNHKGAGLVTGSFVNNEQGRAVIKSWLDAGHIIGNHTYTHQHARDLSAEDYIADIEKNTVFLSGIDAARAKLFRFPFLDEGGELEKRNTIRQYLNANDYLNAAVTLDTMDWYIAQRMDDRLMASPDADLTGYRDYYLASALKLAEYYNAVAADIGRAGTPHTMLVHHNELNGLFLGDLLAHFKANGWELMNADTVFENSLFRVQPASLNKGRSILSVMEQEAAAIEKMERRHWPIAAEFGKADMDALGL